MKDNVNHPEHYLKASAHPSVEPIMFCRLFPFNLGNAIKYILRAEYTGHANEDYSKAIWYLEDFKVNNKVDLNNFNNPHLVEYHIIHWFIEENNTAGRILRKLFAITYKNSPAIGFDSFCVLRFVIVNPSSPYNLSS